MQITGTRRNIFRFRTSTQKDPAAQLNPAYKARIHSIDLLRGAVMVIMALDHVRDYFHADAFRYDPTDLTQTNVALFFTRFVTHFCAPAFMLLSGTAAFLVGERKGRKALSRFLLTRGLWLVLLELTVVNFGWFFDISYTNTGTLVIWALGMSMITLAGLIYLPMRLIAAIGLIMVFGHNMLDGIHFNEGPLQYIWAVLHEPRIFSLGGITWFALYPLVPWIGVMALGYCMGSWYSPSFDGNRRRKLLWQVGLGCTALFFALRFTNWYGEALLWSEQSRTSMTILSFFNLSKYPPSLLYLLITLGPLLMVLSVTERSNGWLSQRLQVIGRVPMFYYLVHIYLIHLAAMLAAELTPGLSWTDMLLTQWVNFSPTLQQYYGISLLATYGVWAGIVLVLYFMCRWYDNYKRSHKHWWLSYV